MLIPAVLTVEEVAALMKCATRTVEDHARAGRLPALKLGESWVFPSDALIRAVNRMAEEEATKRAKPVAPSAVRVKQAGNKPVNLKLLSQQPGGQVLTAQ